MPAPAQGCPRSGQGHCLGSRCGHRGDHQRDTGTYQITAPNSTEASDTGSNDTRTIGNDIKAVMAVTFRVD